MAGRGERTGRNGWDSIVLPDDVRSRLKRCLDHFHDGVAAAPRAVLLAGPPGCGKTHIARAIAEESPARLFYATSADLISPYVAESALKVENLFQKARDAAPAIVYIDELESVARRRDGSRNNFAADEVVPQLLTEMDALGRDDARVMLLAATSSPDALDAAVLMRFLRIDVPQPDESCRRTILTRRLEDVPVEPGFDVPAVAAELAARLDRRSGRDLIQLVGRVYERALLDTDSPESVALTRAALLTEADAMVAAHRRRQAERDAAQKQATETAPVPPAAVSPAAPAVDIRAQLQSGAAANETPIEKAVAFVKRLFTRPD
jgi:transitional endoplasmic reticulum ATPase